MSILSSSVFLAVYGSSLSEELRAMATVYLTTFHMS
jgi:hypothetical protein